MTDRHWAIVLYERYVQLYGEPIDQPITAHDEQVTSISPAGATPCQTQTVNGPGRPS